MDSGLKQPTLLNRLYQTKNSEERKKY